MYFLTEITLFYDNDYEPLDFSESTIIRLVKANDEAEAIKKIKNYFPNKSNMWKRGENKRISNIEIYDTII